MADLTTTYLGLSLRNPIVVASCGLTGTVEGVRKCADAGAGAVVLKSLFEEQIAAETGALGRFDSEGATGEGAEYLQGYGMALGPRDYLGLVRAAKQAVGVPVIASLNCISPRNWADYAEQLQAAGADAIELNVALMPTQARQESGEVEALYGSILHAVKVHVSIPVALKVGPFFSAFANFADRLTRDRAEAPPFTVGWCGPDTTPGRLVWQGADALVLFNRFYPFDIDVEKLQVAAGSPYSSTEEIHTSLRWISLLADRVDCDLAAATGIHEGADVLKQLLAGATVVQVCSTLYRHGLGQIARMLGEIEGWMTAHGFADIAAFRSRLSQAHSDRPQSYERLQYMRFLGGAD